MPAAFPPAPSMRPGAPVAVSPCDDGGDRLATSARHPAPWAEPRGWGHRRGGISDLVACPARFPSGGPAPPASVYREVTQHSPDGASVGETATVMLAATQGHGSLVLAGLIAGLIFAALSIRVAGRFSVRAGVSPWHLHPAIWGLIGFVLGLIGFLLVFVARATTRPERPGTTESSLAMRNG